MGCHSGLSSGSIGMRKLALLGITALLYLLKDEIMVGVNEQGTS